MPRFDPFFRASRQAGGFGIGLATVRRLVEAHHGRIALSSEMGRGTTVRVELPRVNPPVDTAPRGGATHA